jgi:hypothetical protein
MLTVEITEDSSVVELHGDSAGLLALAGVLTELAARQIPDHAHLLSDEWGGNLLTSQAQNERGTAVHHFKIMVWPRSRNDANE